MQTGTPVISPETLLLRTTPRNTQTNTSRHEQKHCAQRNTTRTFVLSAFLFRLMCTPTNQHRLAGSCFAMCTVYCKPYLHVQNMSKQRANNLPSSFPSRFTPDFGMLLQEFKKRKTSSCLALAKSAKIRMMKAEGRNKDEHTHLKHMATNEPPKCSGDQPTVCVFQSARTLKQVASNAKHTKMRYSSLSS